MKTKITEMLGIEYPIIQGGMAWVAEHHLAAAVSEAGGLGLIGRLPSTQVRLSARRSAKARGADKEAVWCQCHADEPVCG